MKHDNFSEFSYGYALTEELVYWSGSAITASPVFPSLREEGEEGGGYDVKIPQYGSFLFLQFKLSEYMLGRRNTKEVKQGRFKGLFYRISIRSSRYSKQHESLLKLEALGESVYYVAPVFHEAKDFHLGYIKGDIAKKSIFIPPQQIGEFNDEQPHYVSFQNPNDTIYKLSEPVEIGIATSFENFTESVSESLLAKGESALRESALNQLITNIIGIIVNLSLIDENTNLNYLLRDRNLIERIAYLAHVFFGCQLYIISRKG